MESISTSEHRSWANNLGYTFGELDNITSMSEDELRDSLNILGLLFFPDGKDWQGQTCIEYWNDSWWENAWKQLGAERADLLWNLFDKVRFYEVVEAQIEDEVA